MSMAVDQLRGAMRGLGTDEHALIAILTRYSPAQMIQISQAYKGTFGVSLAEQIRKETSFKFGATCEALATPLPEYEALCLEKAMRGMGTNEKLLVEILAGRSNYELQVIRQAYQAIFHKELEQAVHSELSGDFRRFMIALLQGRRDESGQISDVNADIDTLYRAGEGKWGTDEGAFIGILCTRSYPVLVSIFDGYQRKHNHTFEKAIEKEFSGHLKHGILALVHSARNRADYIATELEDAMHGLGTNDEKLIRTLVRHREPRLMQAVKHAFSQRYGKSLYGRVEGETSGDYRRVVLAIVGAN
ncbi:annexin A4 [Polychytrium aggregatum]|uniref:annexin A4 n=1 Tax=Polychytrium aggregatum TaxID=110093 RepID=UPI0022FED1F4|nr:annexin A4 [Polychytrium aggregatum]KAI9206891.1 annexin A4 [Polychytrium aggregatum]